MKNRKALIIYILIFLAGLSVMLYPAISDAWNNHRSHTVIRSYQDNVGVSEEYCRTQMENAIAYNDRLSPKTVPDAFSIRDGEDDKTYESILNPSGDGMMGYVEIPQIDVEVPIYHYTTEEVLKIGAGHLLGSSLPVGGEGTHAVIVAHRGLPNAKLFTDLNLLKGGDIFFIHVANETLTYEVDQIKVVEPDRTEDLQIKSEGDYVTLLTCTPYGVNTHRLLVRGHRTELTENVETQRTRADYSRIIITILCIMAGAVAAFLIVKIADRRRRD